MRKLKLSMIVVILLIIGSTFTVLAGSSLDLKNPAQKRLEAQTIITPQQQAMMDQEMALKAAALKDYVPTVVPLSPYFIDTAKKLNVDITGLTDDEIMIKVKEAEVQYAIDHPVILTPQEQAEIDRLTAEKNAQISQ